MKEEARSPEQAPEAREAPVAVRLEGIRKRFGYREALRGVDLTLLAGRCLALFGPNGAGKSTLLRILSTRWKPSSGRGDVFGADLVREVVRIRRRVGVVAHHSYLRGELTLDENLQFARDLYGVRSSDTSDALVERVGLAHRRRDRVGTFSEGMAKRASLARSLIHDPDLWLLDEPFSGLDPEGRELVASLIRERIAQKGTVVLVTHRVDLGSELADRTETMVDGALRKEDATP